jgi:hypothetical protein
MICALVVLIGCTRYPGDSAVDDNAAQYLENGIDYGRLGFVYAGVGRFAIWQDNWAQLRILPGITKVYLKPTDNEFVSEVMTFSRVTEKSITRNKWPLSGEYIEVEGKPCSSRFGNSRGSMGQMRFGRIYKICEAVGYYTYRGDDYYISYYSMTPEKEIVEVTYILNGTELPQDVVTMPEIKQYMHKRMQETLRLN